MSVPPADEGRARALGRFLEIQNLGLNLPFALAFLFLAAGGLPSVLTVALIVIAFVAARNAGHSFNRWVDRRQDALNPRTRTRALVTGRWSPAFALGFAGVNAVVMAVAACFLNPLSFALVPVALALVWGYSYTKRFTALTTSFLGLVEAAIPGAIYIAIQGRLPGVALLAVAAMLLWGTAFETIHSLGDLESDRALGLRSLPLALGRRRTLVVLPLLHAAALVAFAFYGLWLDLGVFYDLGLLAMVALIAATDVEVARRPASVERPFRRHFALGAIFLGAVILALFVAPKLG